MKKFIINCKHSLKPLYFFYFGGCMKNFQWAMALITPTLLNNTHTVSTNRNNLWSSCLFVCDLGPKSLVWTSKKVDSRWLWWRTMMRFVYCDMSASNKAHTLSYKATNKQYLVVSSLCRVESRSIHSCSSWPAPRAVNTCGSAPWRATPSSGYGSQPQARQAAATSHGSDPASDSGRAQRRTHSCSLLINLSTYHIIVNTSWLSQVVVSSTRTSIWGIMCHMKQSLCIYGYSVSMVTWICSYGDWDFPFILFVFFRLLSEIILTLEGHFLSFVGAAKESLKSVLHYSQWIHSQVTGGGSKNRNTCPVQCDPSEYTLVGLTYVEPCVPANFSVLA